MVGKAWPALGDADRFVRYAARVAIERQPVDSWVARLRDESRPSAIIEGCVAMARLSQRPDTQPMISVRCNIIERQRLWCRLAMSNQQFEATIAIEICDCCART